jgi:hypothetical protein
LKHGRRRAQIVGAHFAGEEMLLERRTVCIRHVVQQIPLGRQRVDGFLMRHWITSAVLRW